MIHSSDNPKIRHAQAVRAGRFHDLILIEGERGVLEAARNELPFELLLAAPEVTETLEGALASEPESLVPLPTSPKLLASLSDLDAPKNVIAVVKKTRPDAAQFRFDRDRQVAVYADGVQDPVNLGALARVCAAVGADALLTSPGCAHPNHHRAVRASAFSLMTLAVYPGFSWTQLRSVVKASAHWIALDPRASQSIYDCNMKDPWVAVIGGEMGISPEHLRELPGAAIPMPGDVESLNLAVAAGIALFEWTRRL